MQDPLTHAERLTVDLLTVLLWIATFAMSVRLVEWVGTPS